MSSLSSDTVPVPLQIFVSRRLLTAEQLAVLQTLETFFPEGLFDQNWSNDEPVGDSEDRQIDALMKTWREKRPEQQPPAPIWKCDRNTIATCPHLSELVTSHDQLWDEAIANDLSLPQWIVAAWWWGCAAVVCNTSTEKLESAIMGWQQRYRCAVLYLQSPEMKQDPELVAEYRADLSYGNSAHVPQSVDLAWAAKDDFNWKYWQLPSALQPWGSRAQLGKDVMARPQP
ncbi:MAG: hypothetical protein ACFCU8_00145 [Thermosynechococcaceae cyanobacterium]